MPDAQVPLQVRQGLPSKHVVHQAQPLERTDLHAVAHHDAGAFLAPVLKGKQALIKKGRRVGDSVDTDDTTGLARRVGRIGRVG